MRAFNQVEDDPQVRAQEFAAQMSKANYNFDFSLESLEKEVDRFLESSLGVSHFSKGELESLLTAYIGETIRQLYQGEWTGEYWYAHPGRNFYLCKVTINEYEFYPSHFIGYYLANGKKSTSSFYHYLHNLDFFTTPS